VRDPEVDAKGSSPNTNFDRRKRGGGVGEGGLRWYRSRKRLEPRTIGSPDGANPAAKISETRYEKDSRKCLETVLRKLRAR